MNRNITLQLCIVISASSFAATPLFAKSVLHFNNQTKGWGVEEIMGLKNISHIQAAGKFAWAVNNDKNQIAFFNGIQWLAATSLPGMAKIYNVKPGFPINGKEPIAWALGVDTDKKYVIDYFDGNTWRMSYSSSTAKELVLVATGGYAWVLSRYDTEGENFSNSYDIRMSSQSTSGEWKYISITFQYADSPASISINANDDEQPGLFTLVKSEDYQTQTLYRLSVNQQWATLKSNLVTPTTVDVNKNTIWLQYLRGDNSISFDNGITWRDILIPKVNYFFVSDLDVDSSLICMFDQVEGIPNRFYCADMQDGQSNWKSDKIDFRLGTFKVVTDNKGAWIDSKLGPSALADIYRFDMATAKFIDTHLSSVSAEHDYYYDNWPMYVISENEVATCGISKDKNLSAFYFDGKQWIVTAFAKQGIFTCDFSIGEGKADLWVYT
jgi:hypothetical protein